MRSKSPIFELWIMFGLMNSFSIHVCSRERFGEVNAKTWWEDNRERIQAQYL